MMNIAVIKVIDLCFIMQRKDYNTHAASLTRLVNKQCRSKCEINRQNAFTGNQSARYRLQKKRWTITSEDRRVCSNSVMAIKGH